MCECVYLFVCLFVCLFAFLVLFSLLLNCFRLLILTNAPARKYMYHIHSMQNHIEPYNHTPKFFSTLYFIYRFFFRCRCRRHSDHHRYIFYFCVHCVFFSIFFFFASTTPTFVSVHDLVICALLSSSLSMAPKLHHRPIVLNNEFAIFRKRSRIRAHMCAARLFLWTEHADNGIILMWALCDLLAKMTDIQRIIVKLNLDFALEISVQLTWATMKYCKPSIYIHCYD